MDKKISVISDLDGKKIVVISDIRFKGKRNINWEEVEQYLKDTHEEVVIKNKNQALQIMVKEEAVEELSEQLVEAEEV